MTFRLSCVVVIVVNSIVSYFYERVIVWQISICWKNREDRKIHREQRLQIEEQHKLLAQEEIVIAVPSEPKVTNESEKSRHGDKFEIKEQEMQLLLEEHHQSKQAFRSSSIQKEEEHDEQSVDQEEKKLNESIENDNEHQIILR